MFMLKVYAPEEFSYQQVHRYTGFDGGAVKVTSIERHIIDVNPRPLEPLMIEGEVLDQEPS
jgi:hypothetical protein